MLDIGKLFAVIEIHLDVCDLEVESNSLSVLEMNFIDGY